MLRIRKRTRGARSPDIDPYSKETRETKRERPRRMLRYLEMISRSANLHAMVQSEGGLPL